MAKLLFILDHEEGHLLSTMKLARQLAERGHSVHYLGLAEGADLVRRHGFEFTPILEDVLPKGTAVAMQEEMARLMQSPGWASASTQGKELELNPSLRYLHHLVKGEDFDTKLRALQPDLLLITSHYIVHALALHYRYRLPMVLLNPSLRAFPKSQYSAALQGLLLEIGLGAEPLFDLVRKVAPSARRFSDITAPIVAMRELSLYPAEFDLPRKEQEVEAFHIEASVDLDRPEEGDFPWERLDPSKRLVYCSVGSQSRLLGQQKVTRFLRAVAEAAASRPHWQLVLSTGNLIDPAELAAPEGSIVVRWVPQMALLRRSAVMITHSGMGTVKECIFLGVPMAAFPMMRDQPDVAERIVYHRLGARGDFETATAEQIAEMVDRVDQDETIRANVARMRQRFLEIEESRIGVQRIEEVLNGQPFSRRASPPPSAAQGIRPA
jgi:zeaxanthin glucosyltransferase